MKTFEEWINSEESFPYKGLNVVYSNTEGFIAAGPTLDGLKDFLSPDVFAGFIPDDNVLPFTPKENGLVDGVIFTVSNDGGKTGVYWRENVFECLEYHEKYYKEHGNWQVVAVRKKLDNFSDIE